MKHFLYLLITLGALSASEISIKTKTQSSGEVSTHVFANKQLLLMLLSYDHESNTEKVDWVVEPMNFTVAPAVEANKFSISLNRQSKGFEVHLHEDGLMKLILKLDDKFNVLESEIIGADSTEHMNEKKFIDDVLEKHLDEKLKKYSGNLIEEKK